MKNVRRRVKGSLTVEAACVMAMVLFSMSVMLHEAGRIHDETAGAMNLHEAVEKVRHEKYFDGNEASHRAQRHMGRLMSFPSYTVEIKRKYGRVHGNGRGGGWNRTIDVKMFRPETFLRKITLIEGLGEDNGY